MQTKHFVFKTGPKVKGQLLVNTGTNYSIPIKMSNYKKIP